MNEDEDAFPEPDGFGLLSDDWISLSLGHHPWDYTGPALLWWAFAGLSEKESPYVMNEPPFLTLLTSLAGDAGALAGLASSSFSDDVRELAPALKNLHRRIEAAALIAGRIEEDEVSDISGRSSRPRPAPLPALPPAKVPTLRRKR